MSIESSDILGLRGEHNTAGCYRLYLVDADDVVSVPSEIQGNVPGDVVLDTGKVFTRITPSTFEMVFGEDSTYNNGAPRVDALLEWPIPKDRLSLLPVLHDFHLMRVVAVVETLNPDPADTQEVTRLLIGNKEEPAMVYLVKRTSGADPRTDRSGYLLQLRWSRSTPTPFYNGTPPDLVLPGECPTLGELLEPMHGDDAFALFTETQQTEAIQAMVPSFLWATLDPAQQAGILVAAGVVTVTRINNSGPPYTDVIIDPS